MKERSISFPIQEVFSNSYYGLIIQDAEEKYFCFSHEMVYEGEGEAIKRDREAGGQIALTRISFPIQKAYASQYYGLMLIDVAGVTHYWDHDFTYDGRSGDPCVDYNTGTPNN